jgi:Domain of unknown function (DUF4386)
MSLTPNAAGQAVAPSPPTPRPRRDPRTYWRWLLALSAPIPALLIAAWNAFTPEALGGDGADFVQAFVEHRGFFETQQQLTLLMVWTFVPSAVAIVWVCRRRSPVLTAVTGTLVLLGFTSGLANPDTHTLVLVGLENDVDPATLTILVNGIDNATYTGLILLPFLLTITLGRVLLGVLLWRVRVAPRWMAVVLALSAPAEFLPIVSGNLQPTIGWAMTAIGFASATVALARMDNDDFDLPAVGRAD